MNERTRQFLNWRRRCYLAATLNTALLAACGGGGGSGDSPALPPAGAGPGNEPPPASPPLPIAKTWQGVELIDSAAAGSSLSPLVALNAQGNALAVWLHSSSNDRRISGYRGIVGKPWSEPFLLDLESNNGTVLQSPSADIDDAGFALSLWVKRKADETGDLVGQRRHPTENSALLFTLQLDPVPNFPFDPDVAYNPRGEAVVVWREENRTSSRLEIRAIQVLTPDLNIAVREVIADIAAEPGNLLSAPKISIVSDGSVLATWVQRVAGENVVMARARVAGQWVTPSQVLGVYSNSSETELPEPSIAMGVGGKAIVVWAENIGGGTRKRIMARRANQFGTNDWAPAERIQTDETGNASNPKVTLDALGNATVVWEQQRRLSSGVVRTDVFANRFDGNTWLVEQQVLNLRDANAFAPQVGSDERGAAIAVWRQVDGLSLPKQRINIFASRLEPTNPAKWSAPEQLNTPEHGNASNPQLAMNARGEAVAVWKQTMGNLERILSNAFNNKSASNQEP